MKEINKYKNDVQNEMTSTSTFEDIKDRVKCKEVVKQERKFNLKPLIGLACIGATAAVVLTVVANLNSTATGALAYQLSPTISKEISKESSNVTVRSVLRAPILKNNKEDTEDTQNNNKKDFSNILYEVDALISNKNSYKIKDIESDKEEYANAQKVSFTLLNGEDSEYVLYYNDINESSYEKKNKSTYEKSFNGLAVSNNVEMKFTFESKEEDKKNKSSFSSITTIYENEVKSNYLVISSFSETKKNKEQESYKYEHYINNVLDDTYTISYDVKKNKTSCTVETKDGSYTVEKKITNKQEMFSIHSKDENRTVNATYKKVIENNGSVDYEE